MVSAPVSPAGGQSDAVGAAAAALVAQIAPSRLPQIAPAPATPAALTPATPPPAPVKGSVCGNPQITGETVAPISGAGGCGVAEPVRIRALDGIRLSSPSVMDCPTAQALLHWVERGVRPAIANEGGGIVSLRVAGDYACRPVNNQSGRRLSEHGKGRAIDIAAFGLKNGGEITVLNGWKSRAHGPRLRQMHAAACGPFGTVLGPAANRLHADHFHFDTARHRNGAYCR